MFAIAGSHRSGKTTLAKALAADLGIEFLETKVSDVFKEFGLDPKADLPFAARMTVQEKILRSLEVQYELRRGKQYIADRSPFDVLGYTMADIKRDTLDEDLRSRVYRQIGLAAEIIAKNLTACILLRPLPDQVDCATSAQACPLYMHHVYTCIKDMSESLAASLNARTGFVCVESFDVDHDARMADCGDFIREIQQHLGLITESPKIWLPNE